MSEIHWFANYCPSFSVFDIERYLSHFGVGSQIHKKNLLALEMNESYQWFLRNEEVWLKQLKKFFHVLKRSENGEFEIIFWGSPLFPPSLKTLACPPALLFSRGDISLFNRPMVAVVGARNPTEIGRLWVQKVIGELASEGVVIVSGGARGIDAEAHWAALEAGGKTIAFLPGAVDRPYPFGNEMIFERIQTSGVLLSEFSPGTVVRRENFHRRNRLIAGLADLVVIVEAGTRSGTMMTANKAIAENREILVVPGPPLVESYSGSLELICQGAGLARDVKDIIFALNKRNVLKLKEETPTLWS